MFSLTICMLVLAIVCDVIQPYHRPNTSSNKIKTVLPLVPRLSPLLPSQLVSSSETKTGSSGGWTVGSWSGASIIPIYPNQLYLTMIQALWLQQGYQLEFLGNSTFVPGLWSSSIFFFGINCSILAIVITDVSRSQAITGHKSYQKLE